MGNGSFKENEGLRVFERKDGLLKMESCGESSKKKKWLEKSGGRGVVFNERKKMKEEKTV